MRPMRPMRPMGPMESAYAMRSGRSHLEALANMVTKGKSPIGPPASEEDDRLLLCGLLTSRAHLRCTWTSCKDEATYALVLRSTRSGVTRRVLWPLCVRDLTYAYSFFFNETDSLAQRLAQRRDLPQRGSYASAPIALAAPATPDPEQG